MRQNFANSAVPHFSLNCLMCGKCLGKLVISAARVKWKFAKCAAKVRFFVLESCSNIAS